MADRSPEVNSHWSDTDSGWDWFFFVTLALLLLLAPISLGIVEAWSELVAVTLAAVLALGLLARLWLQPDFRGARTRAYLPLGFIVGLIIFQLLPLPEGVLQVISSKSVDLRANLLGELMPRGEEGLTLSLYPYETAHDLRMALIFIAVFATVASVFRSEPQIKRALWGIFLLGCAEAVVALLQILTLSRKIHWIYGEGGSIVTAGSFVNHSHFCQFMNLALGAGVAILLVRMKEDGQRDRGQVSRLVDLRGDRYLRPLAGIVLCVVAVLTSMSRNGAISLLLASGVIAVALYRRGVISTRGWLLAIVPWAVVLIVFLTCFDTIYERFATLEDQDSLGGRLELTRGVLRAWADFPLLGSGLGTHEYLFPLYDSSTVSSMAEHADNDWAQLLEEFGLLGAGAVVTFVLVIFGIAARLMIYGTSSLSTAAFGLTLGLLATAWHSLSDFGQHLPGVFTLTASISGLIVAIAQYERGQQGAPGRRENSGPPNRDAGRNLPLLAILSMLTVAVSGWALTTAFKSSRAESWASVAYAMEQRIADDEWIENEADFSDLLVAAEQAASFEPGNVRHGHLLNLYRWAAISRNSDGESGKLLLSEESLTFVSRIADELALLRIVCPLYGPVYGLEGELRTFVLGEESGKQLIIDAARLNPFDAATSFTAGQLAAREGRWDDADALLGRTVMLDPRLYRDVASRLVREFNRVELAQQLAGNDYRRLKALAAILDASDLAEHKQAATDLETLALQRLKELVAKEEASAGEIYTLARIELDAENSELGIKLLRRALTLEYGRVSWRLLLARTLRDQGDYDQALREARIAKRLSRRKQVAERLIEEIFALKERRAP